MKTFTAPEMPVIRFFEFPQVLVSLAPLERSASYIRRHVLEKCPNLGLPENLSKILEECKVPQAVKIQHALYVTGNNADTKYSDVLQILNSSKIIRPCRLSTGIRMMLADLKGLPLHVTDADYSLAILSGCMGESIEVNFVRGKSTHCDYRTLSVCAHTPLIMETDTI